MCIVLEIGGRAWGRTIKLIKQSAVYNRPILCRTEEQKEKIIELIEDLKLTECCPAPQTFEEWRTNNGNKN